VSPFKPILVGQWSILMALAIVLGLSFGFNYGLSNQLYYLLPSLVEANPGILTQDWLVNETKHYHPVFGALGTWIIRADPSGWLIALSSVTVIAAVGVTVARLAWHLDRKGWLVGAILAITVCVATRTLGPGGTYVVSRILQPSSFGALGLLVGALFFAKDERWKCGFALGIGGAFHANYLLMGLLIFGFAGLLNVLAEDRRRSFRAFCLGALRQVMPLLLPSVVILLWMLPMILESSSGPHADLVQRIYQDVRGPHHYVVTSFWRAFLPWLGWQALGAGALVEMRASWGDRADRVQRALLAILLLVSFCAFFSSVIRIRSINHLFAWRVAPIGALIAQVTFFTALGARARFWPQRRPAIVLEAGGILCLSVGAILLKDALPLVLVTGGVVIAGVRFLLSEWRLRFAESVPPAMAIILFASFAARPLSDIEQRSNLLRESPRGLGALCQWVQRETPKDAIFLIPPDFPEFRFHCRRAIVVDWKGDPLLPKDFMAWIRRMEDVTGRSPLKGPPDVKRFYSLDNEQLRKVARRYKAEYIVTRKGKRKKRIEAKRLYSSKQFEVYEVP